MEISWIVDTYIKRKIKSNNSNKQSSAKKYLKEYCVWDLPFMFNALWHLNMVHSRGRGCMADINRWISKMRINRRQIKDTKNNKKNVNGKQASCMCTIQRKTVSPECKNKYYVQSNHYQKQSILQGKILRGATTTPK